MPPGSPLLTACVGHAVQTDQRSHDKERANTGAHSAAGPIVYNTWAPRNTEKKTERKGTRKSFGPSVCLDSRQTKRRESFVKVFS